VKILLKTLPHFYYYYKICFKKVENKVNQKYPHLLGGKFENGDIFGLLKNVFVYLLLGI
jgi:hypothetical protein